MSDTAMQQENSTGAENTQEARTFTQSELDEIVQARIGRERAKYADYEEMKQKASKFDEMEEAGKSELQKANERADALQKQLDSLTKATELRNIREKVSTETGVPSNLLSAETEEACAEQAKAILAFANNSKAGYPSVKDSGEIQNVPKTTGEQFAEWLSESLS